MATFELQNLYVGDNLPHHILRQIENARIGPFTIQLGHNYNTQVSNLSQPGQFHSNWNWARGGPIEIEEFRISARPAQGWVTTAVATRDDTVDDRSLLAESPINDGGLWDLCELLTLFSGRRVTSPCYSERYGAAYRYVGRGMKLHLLTLHATAHAWDGRSQFSRLEMEMALPSHNQAVYDMIQTQVSHYTTALDIICAKYEPSGTTAVGNTAIAKNVRRELKDAVEAAVRVCGGLTDDQKDSFIRVLNARIDQGLAKGFLAKLKDLLQDLGAVDDPLTSEANARIRLLDSLRNSVIHTGRLPRPEAGESREDLGRRMAWIASQVLPEINEQAFYRVLGFSEGDRSHFGLDMNVLRRYIVEGYIGESVEDISVIRRLDRVLGDGATSGPDATSGGEDTY